MVEKGYVSELPFLNCVFKNVFTVFPNRLNTFPETVAQFIKTEHKTENSWPPLCRNSVNLLQNETLDSINHNLCSPNWFFPPQRYTQLLVSYTLLSREGNFFHIQYCEYIINIALTQSYQNRIKCIFVYPMSTNGLAQPSFTEPYCKLIVDTKTLLVLRIHKCYLFWQNSVFALILYVKWKTLQ